MAFNWKTFRTRTLTAIIFAAVMLAGLLWDQWSFLVLFSIIHFGCWWEYFNLLEKIYNTTYHRYTKLGFMLAGYAIMLGFCGPIFEINDYRLKDNFSFPVSIAGFVMLGMGIFQTKNINLKAFGTATIGLLYISLSWGLMVNLYKETDISIHDTKLVFGNPRIPLMIIVSIWINDTMAYIVGSLIGKTPLSKISPKKTWEGTIGGIILSVGVVGLAVFYGLFNSWPVAIAIMILAGIASITGTFGDLLESKLKRMAGVKDSGNIMPGHGGFLDRFDSLLLAVPAVWLYVFLFMK
ncbi:MAG TPA: phosphatidate cytidylyltransferase [Chitinophagaceae bacterium]|nr:phosphatidate cytidylyltransferase [Chitinophagaceae bacterium]